MSNKPKINMENFEVFLMDYFDGTLSPEMTDELMAFLDSNPDLKAELEDFDNFNLNHIEEFSENNSLKNSLKREDSEQPKNFINHDNLDDYLIHGLENNLNPSESEALRTFLILNPEAQKSANLVENLKLTPDKKVRFEDKNLLYKTSKLSNLTLSEDTAEEFIIAFCEGDLTNKEAENLKKWIAANPKWQSVLAVYQNMKLTPDKTVRFGDKNLLYKTYKLSNLILSEDTAEEFIIAFCEGDLTNKEAENLKKWIAANPKWQSVLAVYQNLKLSPDYSIQFPNKDSLRIRTHISWYNTVAYRYISSIAAVLVVFLFFPSLINNGVIEQTIYHQPTEIQTNQPKELSSSNSLFQQDETAQPTTNTAISETENLSSKTSTVKKQSRNKTTLQKFSTKKPKPTLILTTNMNPVKPEFCFASSSISNGYYEVTMQKDNFLNNNPDLKKRVIKGLRSALNIDKEEIKAPEDKLTLWDLADFGAKSLSNLTETEITITRK